MTRCAALRIEKNRVDNGGDNVVKGVCPGSDAEAAGGKKDCKVDPRHRPKNELAPAWLIDQHELMVDEDDMVMRAEQRRGNQHGQDDRIVVPDADDILGNLGSLDDIDD